MILLCNKSYIHQSLQIQFILFPGTVDFTMFTNVLQVLEVYNGTNGLLGGGSHLGPWLYIDSSTVDPQTSRKISTAISRCHLKENKG
jgi:hypothetical protein